MQVISGYDWVKLKRDTQQNFKRNLNRKNKKKVPAHAKKLQKPNKYRNYCTVKRLHNFYCLNQPSGLIELCRHRLYLSAKVWHLP